MTRLLLTNAVCFKGIWSSKFDSAWTAKRPFHLAGGKTIETQMMRQRGTLRFFEDEQRRPWRCPTPGGSRW